ncbi:MAG TPA: iron ABC transporter permease [Gemmatimonadaceae bacterium]
MTATEAVETSGEAGLEPLPIEDPPASRGEAGVSHRMLGAGVILLAAIVAAPMTAVALNALEPRWEVWRHLAETRLVGLAWNTLRLLAGVAAGAGALGVTLAWLVAVHRFPGRAVFEWALVLPLAVPAYVYGFIIIALLDYTGPVQTWLRSTFGSGLILPDIRSYWGVVAVMSLVFYPYVYLVAKAAFAERGIAMVEAAHSLGQTSLAGFWRLAMPLARPAIAAGMTLALMETLADFGTVSVFGYDTFTTAIYRVWFGMFDRTAAGQIALTLMGFAALLLILERTSRGRRRFGIADAGRTRLVELRRSRAWLATAACSAVLAVAFVLPAGVLVTWSVRALAAGAVAGTYPELVGNTVSVALGAAVLTVGAALLLAYRARLAPSRWLRGLSTVALLGYAIPGSVVAVGVLLVLARIDRVLEAMAGALAGFGPPPLLAASVAGLLFAYLVRFIAIAYYPVQAGLARIPVALDESAQVLGAGRGAVLRQVHAPLLRGSLTTAAILVFVEVLKELPATMLIRPFGFDTLAVEVWQRTNDAMWIEAAPPSLAIVAAGAVLVWLLTHARGSRALRMKPR